MKESPSVVAEVAAAEAEDLAWRALLDWRRGGPPAALPGARGAAALLDLYGPLVAGAARLPYAVAHLAQSLDGKIACLGGASRWLSGEEDLLHAHRMRALADAVVVGARTVEHDDPQLTVRRCPGEHPVRVVIDPELRLSLRHRVFRDEAAPTLVIAASDRAPTGERHGNAEIVAVPRGAGGLDPHEIRAALAKRGLYRLFIEGGGVTISRFLAARALDRLQIIVAPVLLGSGRPSIMLPEIAEPRHGLRPRIRRVMFGDDVMFECIFDA